MPILEDEYDAVYKIVIIGDTGVGKSSLLRRFADDEFCASHISTIELASSDAVGVDFKVRTVQRKNGKRAKLQIWDTAGQERFRTITNSYYRGADGIILVYSSTDPRSLDNVKGWLSECHRGAGEASKLLVANKSDLVSERAVDAQQAVETSEALGIPLLETSAKDATGIEGTFTTLVEAIAARRAEYRATLPPKTSDDKLMPTLRGGQKTSTVENWLSRCSIL